MKLTYLFLNLFTFLPIVVFSFDKQLRFYSYWKYTLPGILAIATGFIIWDYYFTLSGVWQFNPSYVLNYRFFQLPLEEILFFLTTPFACLFIYESVCVYYNPNWLHRIAKPLALLLATCMGAVAAAFPEKAYTSMNFGLGSFVLLAAIWWMDSKTLGQFWLAFLVHLVPFYIVNGVLTSWPILIYNDSENLGIRVGTIPLEDHAYSLILFLTNLWAYLWFKREKPIHASQSQDNH